MALRRADEEGAAATVGERGAEDFGPDLGLHAGELVEDDEIETAAAERIRMISAAKRDDAAAVEMNGEIGFADGVGGIGRDQFFEARPGDGLGLAIGGGDVPSH